MYQGKTEESEYTAWELTQLRISRFHSFTAITNFAQKNSLYIGWKGRFIILGIVTLKHSKLLMHVKRAYVLSNAIEGHKMKLISIQLVLLGSSFWSHFFVAAQSRHKISEVFLEDINKQWKIFPFSKLRLNSFKMVAILPTSHWNCTTHICKTAKIIYSRDQTLALYAENHFVFEVEMMPIEDIQERRSDGAWNVSFSALLMPAYKVAKVAGPGAFKRSGHFLWWRIFDKAQKLSVCHKLVKCYGNLQDKLQLTSLLLR